MLTTMDPTVLDEMEEVAETTRSPRIVLWLMAMGLAGLLLPLYLISTVIKDNNRTSKTSLAQLDQQTSDLAQPGTDQQTLQDNLIKARQQLDTLDTVQTDLVDHHANWPAVMAVIGNNGYVQMELTGLSQTDNQIVLNGQAEAESVVMAYARMLEESGQFTRVVMQSISLKVLPTPTPLPTATPAATQTPAASGPVSTPVPAEPEQVVQFIIMVELQSQGGQK